MKKLSSILAIISLLWSAGLTAESVDIDFNYTDNHRVDFSNLKGSLHIGEFKDERSGVAPNLITSVNFGHTTDGYSSSKPIADLIEDALKQGFISGGATLAGDDADFTLTGGILAIDAVEVERDGVKNIQITFRTKLELNSGGRNIWQTTLFGRGIAPLKEGIVPAVQGALSRTIRELVSDDYFKMEIL
jgi:hypothetical protein